MPTATSRKGYPDMACTHGTEPRHFRGDSDTDRFQLRRRAPWRLCRVVFFGLAIAAISSTQAWGQTAPLSANLAVHLQRVQVEVIGGRIWILSRSQGGTITSTSQRGGREERLRLSLHTGIPAIEYSLSSEMMDLTISARDGQYVHVVREPKEGATIERLEFLQAPGEAVKLTLGRDPEKKTFQAPSLWHLLLEEPAICREQLIPLLELLRPNWQLAATASELETELSSLALQRSHGRRAIWNQWVARLGSDSFAQRERADRALRQAGPAILGYLHGIELDRLDAEQRFRIRRIIAAISSREAEDTPQIASRRLVADPRVWLALLKRPELPARRLATEQLARLLDRTIPFDPSADAATRQAQLDALREQLNFAPAN